jgi:Transcriptional regulators
MKLTSQPLGFLLVDVARLLRRNFDGELAKGGLGLTAGEARTLLRCGRYEALGGLRQSVLAEIMSVEPMTLVGYIDRLEKAGLVTRVPDPADRRAKLIRILPAAHPVLAQIEEIAHRIIAEATGALSEEETERLRGTLAMICDRLAGMGRDDGA